MVLCCVLVLRVHIAPEQSVSHVANVSAIILRYEKEVEIIIIESSSPENTSIVRHEVSYVIIGRQEF